MTAERTWTKEQREAAQAVISAGMWKSLVEGEPVIGGLLWNEQRAWIVCAEIAKHAHRFVSYGFMVDERDAACAEADAMRKELEETKKERETYRSAWNRAEHVVMPAAIARAVQAERERCEKIVDEQNAVGSNCRKCCGEIAEKIRANPPSGAQASEPTLPHYEGVPKMTQCIHGRRFEEQCWDCCEIRVHEIIKQDIDTPISTLSARLTALERAAQKQNTDASGPVAQSVEQLTDVGKVGGSNPSGIEASVPPSVPQMPTREEISRKLFEAKASAGAGNRFDVMADAVLALLAERDEAWAARLKEGEAHWDKLMVLREQRLRASQERVAELERERDRLKQDMAFVRRAVGGKHTRSEDCIGCGCMMISTTELAAEAERRLAEQPALAIEAVALLQEYVIDGPGESRIERIKRREELLRKHFRPAPAPELVPWEREGMKAHAAIDKLGIDTSMHLGDRVVEVVSRVETLGKANEALQRAVDKMRNAAPSAISDEELAAALYRERGATRDWCALKDFEQKDWFGVARRARALLGAKPLDVTADDVKRASGQQHGTSDWPSEFARCLNAAIASRAKPVSGGEGRA